MTGTWAAPILERRSWASGLLGNARVLDETLRDGIQSPSAIDPRLDEKLALLHLMDELGVEQLDVGLPGAGAHQREAIERLCREIASAKLSIKANVACRTVISDIEPVAEIIQRTGVPLEVYAFIGSSPIRQFAEEWDLAFIEKQSVDAISFAVKQGLAGRLCHRGHHPLAARGSAPSVPLRDPRRRAPALPLRHLRPRHSRRRRRPW